MYVVFVDFVLTFYRFFVVPYSINSWVGSQSLVPYWSLDTHLGLCIFSLNNDVIDFRFWQGFAQSWIKSSCGYMKDNVCEVLVGKLLLLLSVRWQIWSNNFGDCNQYRETEIAHGLLCQIILWLCAISQSIHVLLEIHWMSDQTWYLDTGQQRMFLITAVLKLNRRVLEATNSKNGTLVSVVR